MDLTQQKSDLSMQEIFPESPLIAYKKQNNFGDFFIKA